MVLILYPITIQIVLPKITLRLAQSFVSYLKLSPKSKNPREPTANGPHFFSVTATPLEAALITLGQNGGNNFLRN